MARYIDLEELARRIAKNIKAESPEEKDLLEWCKDECVRQGYCMPTADVGQRAEVARGIFEEIERIIEKSKYQQATPHGTEERYNPYVIVRQVAELKKKYTEEK